MGLFRIIHPGTGVNYLATYIFCLLLSLMMVGRLFAQISPPGLSDTRLASWMAIGLEQSLSEHPSWQSFSYIGYGFMSNAGGPYHLFENPSMLIINQEFKKKLTAHFSLTGAMSYRRQYRYADDRPYHRTEPPVKTELRTYGKFAYNWTTDKIKWNIDFRPEFRKFFLTGMQGLWPDKALRARFKLKSTLPLTDRLNHFLILSAESLFQSEKMVSDEPSQGDWTGFFYDDSRFCIYYRYVPEGWPFYAEIGYMNNLAGKSPAIAMHHIGLDLVFKNVF